MFLSSRWMVPWLALGLASSRALSSARTTTQLSQLMQLTQDAIQYRLTEQRLRALKRLGEACAQRIPYEFAKPSKRDDEKPSTVLEKVPNLIDIHTLSQIRDKVHEMEECGYLSTNPDSVDGLPSLHLNIISNGKPLVEKETATDDFEEGLCDLFQLIEPFVYGNLLSRVQSLLQDDSVAVQDVFVRRYHGQRRGISPHFDVYARATCVCALDDTAADGRNGLYTCVDTSNHASLRRFFPLAEGDAVVHTWNVLHGVHVDANVERTSLVVWFGNQSNDGEPTWLQPKGEDDDINNFVLASALESMDMEGVDRQTGQPATLEADPSRLCDLYLKSAARGNSFALNRLGGLCEEGLLSEYHQREAYQVLESLRPSSEPSDDLDAILGEETDPTMRQARLFWYQGAIRGNPLSQRALADEIMLEASESNDADARHLAAVLFALAAQQGIEPAVESLSRVVEYEVAARGIDTQEEFAASPVVQVAQIACQHLDEGA